MSKQKKHKLIFPPRYARGDPRNMERQGGSATISSSAPVHNPTAKSEQDDPERYKR